MMSQEERDGYLKLLEEVQGAIESGEFSTRETRERLDRLATRVSAVNERAIALAQEFMQGAPSIAVDGRWHRSSALKYIRTPLGTDGSRIHPARYHGPKSGGALYLTESAQTAAAELRGAVKKDIFVTYPLDMKLHRILDLSSPEACAKSGVIHGFLEVEWQFIHDIIGKKPYTQMIGDLARQNLFEGILYESVRAAGTKNLVLFPETLQVDSFVCVIDEDKVLEDIHGSRPEGLSIRGELPMID